MSRDRALSPRPWRWAEGSRSSLTGRRSVPCLALILVWLLAPARLLAQVETSPQEAFVSMDFDDIPLRQAVQFLLKNRAVSLVTGEKLDEEVTIKLTDVPWQRALDSLLKAHGYAAVHEQGILRIIRVTAPDTTRPHRLPLVIQLKHMDAPTARKILEGMISAQGIIVTPEGEGQHGKTISIIDVPEVLEVIKGLLPEIDVPPLASVGELTRNEDGTVDLRLLSFPLSRLESLLSEKLGLNVFVNGSLAGVVTIHLRHVDWQDALRLILQERGYDFRVQGTVIHIAELERFQQTTITREFTLQYVDGLDLKAYLETMLSPEGKVACYSPAPRTGFEFGTKVSEPRAQRENPDRNRRSKLISVTDRSSVVDEVARQIAILDVLPRQIEVNVKIIQLDRGKLRQHGIDWNTVLAMSGAIRPTNLPWGPHSGRFVPGTFPDPPDGEFAFGALRADQLTAVLRLIEQDESAEVISEPNITALDAIEASILIGQKFPVTTETLDPQTAVRTVTLSYYEDIGIQLLVVPSVSEGDRIHMIIHPAVSSIAELIDGRFPLINTREADTQVMLRSGDTAVIGGLIETRMETRIRRIPVLGRLPLFGRLFRYDDESSKTTELLIFVTPRIVMEPEELTRSLLLDPPRIERLRALQGHFRKVLEP